MNKDPKKSPDWQKEQQEIYKTYLKTSAVGLEVGLAIAIGTLAGYFFDKYFKTAPYGLLVGLSIGILAAAKRLWVFAKKYLEKDKDDDHQS